MVAIQDEGSSYSLIAFDALKRLGASDPIFTYYRGSYALAGYSGIKKPSWVTQQQAKTGRGPSEIFIQVALIGKYISTVKSRYFNLSGETKNSSKEPIVNELGKWF